MRADDGQFEGFQQGYSTKVLTVIKKIGKKPNGRIMYLCSCVCGKEIEVPGYTINRRNRCMCNPLPRNKTGRHNQRHGMSGSRLDTILSGMKDRCFNVNSKDYKNYGGKGITICDEWKNDLKAFKAWAVQAGYKDYLTIERKDVNGNYEPSNCTWIPKANQAFNRSNTIRLEFNGTTRTLNEWSLATGIPLSNIRTRYNQGIRDFDKLFMPVQNK